MSKRNVVFVDCVSTSLNFIKDAQDVGLQPVVLELPWIKKFNPLHYQYTSFGAMPPKVVVAHQNYEATLKLVKALNPIAVIPCTDNSIDWALHLSNDLGLPSSKYKNVDKMRDKNVCQKTLKAHRIRSIETVQYRNKKQALKFFHDHNDIMVIKPSHGTSSINVCVCRTKRQVKNAIKLCSHQGALSSGAPMLQEFIGGDEIVVNTCSCRGVHKVTSIWYYHKKETPGLAPIYLGLEFMQPTHLRFKPIIKYAKSVLNAIGVEYGLCHMEIKLDDDGPILIEANCRTPGGTMPAKYLDLVLGHHETNLSLMAYTNPSKFLEIKEEIIPRKCYGFVKFLVIPKRIFVRHDNFRKCFKGLVSYKHSNFGSLPHAMNQWVEQTIDYHTTGGAIFLANTNYIQMLKDYKFIVRMEQLHLDKLFTIGKK